MNILILSKDPSLFHKKSSSPSDSHDRHVLYLKALRKKDPHATIKIISYTPRSAAYQIQNPVPGLTIIPTRSLHRIFFLRDLDRLINKTTADWMPDLITAQEAWEEGQLGVRYAQKFEIPFIAQVHFDFLSPEWLRESPINILKYFLTVRTLKRSTAIRVVSSPLKNKIVQKLKIRPNQVEVIPVSVTVKYTLKKATQTIPQILYVGRFVKQKNLFLWVTVAQKILEVYPDTQFIMAGEGGELKKIKNRVQQLSLENSFTFLGNVHFSKLNVYYRQASLFLLTSHYEGFGRVIAESYLNQTPVVATKCTGPEDLIVHGKTGYLTSKNDLKNLTKYCLTLLKNPRQARQMGIRGQKFVLKHFNQPLLIESLIQMWLKTKVSS
jgi:glycosyltransferase involved in cell wall biosynthesis